MRGRQSRGGQSEARHAGVNKAVIGTYLQQIVYGSHCIALCKSQIYLGWNRNNDTEVEGHYHYD